MVFSHSTHGVKWKCKFKKGGFMFGIYNAKKLILLIILAVVVAAISGISTYAFVKYLG